MKVFLLLAGLFVFVTPDPQAELLVLNEALGVYKEKVRNVHEQIKIHCSDGTASTFKRRNIDDDSLDLFFAKEDIRVEKELYEKMKKVLAGCQQSKLDAAVITRPRPDPTTASTVTSTTTTTTAVSTTTTTTAAPTTTTTTAPTTTTTTTTTAAPTTTTTTAAPTTTTTTAASTTPTTTTAAPTTTTTTAAPTTTTRTTAAPTTVDDLTTRRPRPRTSLKTLLATAAPTRGRPDTPEMPSSMSKSESTTTSTMISSTASPVQTKPTTMRSITMAEKCKLLTTSVQMADKYRSSRRRRYIKDEVETCDPNKMIDNREVYSYRRDDKRDNDDDDDDDRRTRLRCSRTDRWRCDYIKDKNAYECTPSSCLKYAPASPQKYSGRYSRYRHGSHEEDDDD